MQESRSATYLGVQQRLRRQGKRRLGSQLPRGAPDYVCREPSGEDLTEPGENHASRFDGSSMRDAVWSRPAPPGVALAHRGVDGLRRPAKRKQTKQSAKSSVRSTTSRGHCYRRSDSKSPTRSSRRPSPTDSGLWSAIIAAGQRHARPWPASVPPYGARALQARVPQWPGSPRLTCSARSGSRSSGCPSSRSARRIGISLRAHSRRSRQVRLATG